MAATNLEALPQVVRLIMAVIEKNPSIERFTAAERQHFEQCLLRNGRPDALRDDVDTLVDYAIFLQQSGREAWARAVTDLIRTAIPALQIRKNSRSHQVAGRVRAAMR